MIYLVFRFMGNIEEWLPGVFYIILNDDVTMLGGG